MRIVGLTGGIGSGKSLIRKAFEQLGAPSFKADQEAKDLLWKDSALHNAVANEFGENVLTEGTVDRQKLARVVFGDKEKLKRLNELIHPAVRKAFNDWTQHHKDHPYGIKEAAIMIESNTHRNTDLLILVTAPKELRMKRVMERDGISQQTVEKRMENQWSDEAKKPYADIVLENDGTHHLLPEILRIHRSFAERSG